MKAGADYAPVVIKPLGEITSEVFVDFFRDLQVRFNRYYQAANGISVLTNSLTDTLLARIAKIEKDIYYLENFIDNYQFISGKDDLYNFSYIENFDNNLNSNEYDSFIAPYIDRDNRVSSDNKTSGGYVDMSNSKFRIGDSTSSINLLGLVKSIGIKNNYDQYLSSASDPKKMFDGQHSKVWSVSVKSPTILASLPVDIEKYISYDYSYLLGAKTILEIELNRPVEMDSIKISPNHSDGLKLMQVALEASMPEGGMTISNTSNPSSDFRLVSLLNQSIDIKSGVTIPFALSRVKKVVLIFNQDTYTRSELVASQNELTSRLIHELLMQNREIKKKDHNVLQDLVLSYFRKNISINEAKRNNYSYSEYYTYKYPIEGSIKDETVYSKIRNTSKNLDDVNLENKLRNTSPLSRMVESIISHVLGPRVNLLKNNMFIDNRSGVSSGRISNLEGSAFIPQGNVNINDGLTSNITQALVPGISFENYGSIVNNAEKINSYQYNFSIKSIDFLKTVFTAGSDSSSNNKAIFISKKIPVAGKVLGIKAKLNTEPEYTNNLLDLKYSNSYELSLSVKENPQQEIDWIPVIPYDAEKINSEVLFFNKNSKTAVLRFHPKSTSIQMYENGKLLNPNYYSVNISTSSVFFANYNENNIYVAEYDFDNLNYSQDYIDVAALYSDTPVATMSSNTSQGESFVKTDSSNSVKISQLPYVDYDQFSSASYNRNLGTLNTVTNISYNPVKVRLSDGSFAINLTNYVKGNFEKGEFYETSQVLFYQNGKSLIFNKPINENFDVIYNYINNKIRFRLIIRNNYNNIFSPGSVDNVIVKMKLNNLDSFSEKMLGLQ